MLLISLRCIVSIKRKKLNEWDDMNKPRSHGLKHCWLLLRLLKDIYTRGHPNLASACGFTRLPWIRGRFALQIDQIKTFVLKLVFIYLSSLIHKITLLTNSSETEKWRFYKSQIGILIVRKRYEIGEYVNYKRVGIYRSISQGYMKNNGEKYCGHCTFSDLKYSGWHPKER